MLPAAVRMRRPAEFAATLRSGARAGARPFTVHAAAGRDDRGLRVGFIVSRAVGPAVVRNRVRRRLRHLLRDRLAALPRGLDVVVRVHPPAAGMTSAALGRELDAALARAGDRAQSHKTPVVGA